MVICTGKETNKKTRPTRAGLNMLNPNPPKDNFATPMAIKLPITIIQMGKLDGKLKANKIPVINADPSVMVTSVFNRYFWITYSNSIQEIIATEVTSKAPIPNT